MRRIFKDPELQARFERDGYIRHEIFTDEQIEQLHSAYESLGIETPSNFSNTCLTEDAALKFKVKQIAMPLFQPVIDRLFIDCKSLTYNFLAKGKSDDNHLDFHQDWSFVDESAGHVSMTIWCPLVATSHLNGNLLVVPRTHKLPRVPRQAPHSDTPYSQWRKEYESLAIALPTKLGEAIIFDLAVFHGSTSNVTNEIRLIIASLVIPIEAQPVLFYDTEPGEVAVCEVDEDFFLSNNPFVTKSDRLLEKRKIPVTDYRTEMSRVLGISLAEVASTNSKLEFGKAARPKKFWKRIVEMVRNQ